MQGDSKRAVALIVAAILGLGGVFLLVRYVQASEERALAGTELVTVFMARSEIPAGTSAAVIADFVEETQVPINARAEGSVTDLSALGNLQTSVDIVPGEQLIESRFTDSAIRTIAGLGQSVPEGLFEITVQVGAERAVGGQLSPGDRVAVIATSEVGTDPSLAVPTETRIVLRDALLVNVQSAEFTLTEGDSTERDRSAPQSDFLLTFALNPADTQKLTFAAENTSLWMVREPSLAPESPTEPANYGNFFGIPALAAQPETLAEVDETETVESEEPTDEEVIEPAEG